METQTRFSKTPIYGDDPECVYWDLKRDKFVQTDCTKKVKVEVLCSYRYKDVFPRWDNGLYDVRRRRYQCPLFEKDCPSKHSSCFGNSHNSAGACGKTGKCISHNECECPEGKGGRTCDVDLADLQCGGKLSTDPTVCSSHGDCLSPNQCECHSGYTGKNCELGKCFGISNISKSVCSKRGICVDQNLCECTEDTIRYGGLNCDQKRCGSIGILESNPRVCGGRNRGRCSNWQFFSSSHFKCLCGKEYKGNDCEHTTCFRKSTQVTGTDGETEESLMPCGGPKRGHCAYHDKCICDNMNWQGKECEEMSCNGVRVNSEFAHSNENVSKVCSSHGICVLGDDDDMSSRRSNNLCHCNLFYMGGDCESSIFSISAYLSDGRSVTGLILFVIFFCMFFVCCIVVGGCFLHYYFSPSPSFRDDELFRFEDDEEGGEESGRRHRKRKNNTFNYIIDGKEVGSEDSYYNFSEDSVGLSTPESNVADLIFGSGGVTGEVGGGGGTGIRRKIGVPFTKAEFEKEKKLTSLPPELEGQSVKLPLNVISEYIPSAVVSRYAHQDDDKDEKHVKEFSYEWKNGEYERDSEDLKRLDERSQEFMTDLQRRRAMGDRTPSSGSSSTPDSDGGKGEVGENGEEDRLSDSSLDEDDINVNELDELLKETELTFKEDESSVLYCLAMDCEQTFDDELEYAIHVKNEHPDEVDLLSSTQKKVLDEHLEKTAQK